MTVTIVASGVTSTGNTIASGDTLSVSAGGTEVSGLILSGGTALIAGFDSFTTIALGGSETLTGTASGDVLFGTQLENSAAALVSNESIGNGGALEMYATSGHAANITVGTGGALLLSANAPVNNLLIQGGSVLLESKKSNITGSISFAGAGTINESAVISAGSGVLGLISGFGSGDVLDLSGIGSGASLAVTSGGGNTTLTVSGGSTEGAGVSEGFTLAGMGQVFDLTADPTSTGSEIVLASSANTTIASGQTVTGSYIGSGSTLTVLAGGTDLAGTIAAGGMEIVDGTASGDLLYGTQLENAATALVSNETIFNGGQLQMYATSGQASNLTVETGGTLLLSANAPVNNLVIQGGSVALESKKSNITGAISFAGAGTINESAVISAGYGVLGVISGFGAGDVLDLSGIGSGASLSQTAAGGDTILTVSGGANEGAGVAESFTLSGTGQEFTLSSDPSGTGSEITLNSGGTSTGGSTVVSGFTFGDTLDLADIGTGAITSATTVNGDTILTVSGGSNQGGSVETITFTNTGTVNIYALHTDAAGSGEDVTAIPLLTSFTAGDIVLGVVGDDNNSGYYGDNQAAPIALEEIDPATGQIIGEMVLPQESAGDNSMISGEYGSSSEGILQLSGDGQSLVIGGYGVNAATFNAAPVSVYGNSALAQSTSLTDTTFTPVARVVADIGYDGSVDTSTAVYNVFNTNNIRSVATVDGKTFYISGQGVKGDTTQGVFVVQDGSSAATAIDTATDTRTVEIIDGQLYVSQNSSAGTANIASFGDLPTGAATPTILSGIDQTVTLTAAEENTVNGGAVGTAVALSPEQYFFANATTLYVADGGQPKAGTIGDGGLQKWVLDTATGQWNLAYTLSAGLNLVPNGNSSGTTGLIGLAGVLNANGTVTFYATNSTIGDLDQTYLYTITDTVAATSPAAGEQFTIVSTASPDTNVRGIASAPSAPVNVTVASGVTSSGLNIGDGSTLTVLAGGTASGAVIEYGGLAQIAGQDDGSLIVLGGSETVTGSAAGDAVYGTQIVSGSASGETIHYDGAATLAAGGIATGIAMQAGSELVISGSVAGLVISGGIAALAADTAALSGVTFAGAGEIAELASGGVTGVISGFGAGDVIDLTQFGSGASLTSSVVGGNTMELITSGGVSQAITLAGQFAPGALGLAPDASGTGVELGFVGSTVTGSEEITAGEFATEITVASGGTLIVDAGGTVAQDAILAGGTAIISGLAAGDVIAGSETVAAGGTVTGEMVSGGTLVLAGTANGISAATGSILLEAGGALTGTLALGSDVTLDVAAGSLTALISGFSGADVIELPQFGTGATLTSSVVGGNTVETVSSGGVSESFTFAGTGGAIALQQSAGGDSLITTPPISNGFVVTSAGAEGVADGAYTGPTSAVGLLISSGLVLDDLAGGTVTAPVVLTGGIADILGTENGAVISSGGQIVISAGGIENNATILAGGTETLIGRVTATGDDVYGLQQVTSANAQTGTTLASETIFAGGEVDLFYKTNTLQNSTILSGGLFAINGNATGLNLTLDGGTIALESPKANLMGVLSFAAGGTLQETAVVSAGYGDLATIEGFQAGDAIQLTAIGAGASFTTTLDSAGDEIVTIAGGASQSSAESFTFTGTSAFALLQIAGGAELLGDTTVISAGQTASGGTVGSGFGVLVLSGGTDTGSTLLAGGSETVQSGGTIYIASGSNPGLTLDAGSTEIVGPGVTVSGASVPAGVTLRVEGIVSGDSLASGGSVIVASGGTFYAASGSNAGVTLNSGGTEIVGAGITVSDVTVGSGGNVLVASGGTATLTAIASGGSVAVSSGGTVYAAPGLDSGLTLGDGATEIVGAGIAVSAAAVTSGATLGVLGTVSGTTVSKGGDLIISAGGVGSGTVILQGGRETVLSGGNIFIDSNKTNGLTLSKGAIESIGAGVTVQGEKVITGVSLNVMGTASASTVGFGGMEFIFSGGSVVNGKVLSGGVVTVSSGGTVSGNLTLSGGTALLYGTMDPGKMVKFAGPNAALEMANSGFDNVISGFGAGNLIDFIALPYSAGAALSFSEAKNGKSGVLTVSNGGQEISVTLKGAYTTSNFAVSSGALGGTAVAFTSGGST